MKIDRLIESIERMGNPTALGLDTRVEYLPRFFTGGDPAEGIYKYNCALIEALADIIPSVKIQVAYYEMLGPVGMQIFRDTLLYARQKGMITIADVKRNDIGATAEAYAAAYLGVDAPFPADFVTLNAYLGSDGINPFIKECKNNGGGIFILVRTSNPSASEFQDFSIEGRLLYEHVGEKIAQWGEDLMGECGYSSVGAVVGATWPEESKKLRELFPRTFFLVPGYGAQGATAQDLKDCFDTRRRGAVVNASRSLLCAHQKQKTDDFVLAARIEALRMRDEILSALGGRK